MYKILQVIASPRQANSQSTRIANAYIESKKTNHPDLSIDVLDLWEADLPEFDGDKTAAKMTFFGVGEMDNNTQSAWDQIVSICERFTDADEYVISLPMWNGGIPYKLKHYIDLITQPGLLFGFDPEQGYLGLLNNKKATVIYTAGVFSLEADDKYGLDFQSNYMDWWLKLVGISDIETIRLQPSLVTSDPQAAEDNAISEAQRKAI